MAVELGKLMDPVSKWKLHPVTMGNFDKVPAEVSARRRSWFFTIDQLERLASALTIIAK